MTRTIALIAIASFVLSVGCLAGAAALGWHNFAGRHWPMAWTLNWDDHRHGPRWVRYEGGGSGDATPATRELTWTDTDRLDINLPADVVFTQAAGPAKVTVTGPKDAVDRVMLEGSSLRFSDGWDFDGPVKVTISAPQVRHFSISGASNLDIAGYDQDELDLSVSGKGEIHAKGKAHDVKLDISGNGDADLGGVASDSAEADISGAGRAVLAPASAADLRISGAGEIELKTHPAKVNTDISGLGRIVEPGESSNSARAG
jgi:putative autotransporter adhesin-like protein